MNNLSIKSTKNKCQWGWPLDSHQYNVSKTGTEIVDELKQCQDISFFLSFRSVLGEVRVLNMHHYVTFSWKKGGKHRNILSLEVLPNTPTRFHKHGKRYLMYFEI